MKCKNAAKCSSTKSAVKEVYRIISKAFDENFRDYDLDPRDDTLYININGKRLWVNVSES